MKRFTRASATAPRPGLIRGILAVGVAAAVGVAITVVAGTVANAATIDPDTHYQLISRHSGKAITVLNGSTATGAEVVQWTPGDGQNQQFRFVPSGDGYYRIMARHSGHVLDVYAWNANNGADIRQWTDLNGTNQQFQVLDSDSGYLTLINRFSSKALDVWAWSTADGGRISQDTDSGGTNQQWRLVPVDGETRADRGSDAGQREHRLARSQHDPYLLGLRAVLHPQRGGDADLTGPGPVHPYRRGDPGRRHLGGPVQRR